MIKVIEIIIEIANVFIGIFDIGYKIRKDKHRDDRSESCENQNVKTQE